MALKLTLKPYERVVVNGCLIRNSGRKHALIIEEKADVVRGRDLLDSTSAVTPVSKVYYLVQTALIRADLRDKLVPAIQNHLAGLATVFGPPHVGKVFEAANFVSTSDYYKALRALRYVRDYEHELLHHIAPTSGAADKADAPDEAGDDDIAGERATG